jgi:PII-like signaling protein
MAAGHFLCFYVRENQRHQHALLWEWLLEQGNKLGIGGGSAFRALAGFGRHHRLHEERFFELAGQGGIEVEFIVDEAQSTQLLALINQEKIRIFYACVPAQFGILNPDVADSPEDAS